MELLSRDFENTVRRLFNDPSTSTNAIVLATVPQPKGRPLALVEELKRRRDCRLMDVTRNNRNHLCHEVVAHLSKALNLES